MRRFALHVSFQVTFFIHLLLRLFYYGVAVEFQSPFVYFSDWLQPTSLLKLSLVTFAATRHVTSIVRVDSSFLARYSTD